VKALLEYLKNNLALTIVMAGFAVFLIIIVGVILYLYCKSRKTAKWLQDAKETEKQRAEKKTRALERYAAQDAKTMQSPTQNREKADVDAAEKSIDTKGEQNTDVLSPTQEKQPKKTAKKSERKTPTTAKTPQKAMRGQTKKEPDKTEKSAKDTQNVAKTATNNERKKKIKGKENTVLLDELKDIDTSMDFYEENETDQAARYCGKWVICRIVTSENAAQKTPENEEENYFFELHASNGEKLLSSEEYTSYNGALRGIETHKANILRNNFKITLSKKGDYIFKLLSGKNLLLCLGENYPTRARCESAIESAKRFAKTAIIDENIQDHVVKVPVEDDTEVLPPADGYNGKWIIDTRVGVDGEQLYFFELFANNGEKLLSSEEYTTYIGAVNGIQTHKTNIAEGNFRVTLTKRGDYIYKLLNKNGQLLCLGEHYRTKRRCLNAVESVKRFAKNSPVLADSRLTKHD